MKRTLHWLLLLSTACGSQKPQTGYEVGVLLPFSGDRGASGANTERALIMARESINAAGGLAGQQLHLRVADTHSDSKKAVTGATSLLEDNNIRVIIGPEEAAATTQMIPLVKAHDNIQMLPAITTPPLDGPDTLKGYWFSYAPDATVIGQALASRMYADGVRKAAVLYDNDDYDISLFFAFTNAFSALGGENLRAVPFRPGVSDYAAAVAALRDAGSVVMPAAPGTASRIIQEWSTLKQPGYQWYFAPLLKSRLFAESIPIGAVDGMIGISPSLGTDAAAFTEAFKQRWPEDEPFDAASYYYDALAVTALAVEAAAQQMGQTPDSTSIRNQIRQVASPPGQIIRWNELELGLKIVREGGDIDYQGISGPIDFDLRGRATVQDSGVQFWSVQQRQIVTAEGTQ